MKLIKLSTDHYIVVDDSEIKEGDWMYNPEREPSLLQCIGKGSIRGWKKITHSTKSLEQINFVDEAEGLIMPKVNSIFLQEVKELTGEVDVEKKAEEFSNKLKNDDDAVDFGYINGYNQCLEDNKNRKYTEEDMINAHFIGWIDRGEISNIQYPKARNLFIQSIQPKTEWEVEYDEKGKLKLKQ